MAVLTTIQNLLKTPPLLCMDEEDVPLENRRFLDRPASLISIAAIGTFLAGECFSLTRERIIGFCRRPSIGDTELAAPMANYQNLA